MTAYRNDGILYLCRREVEQLCKEIDSVAILHDLFKMHASGQTILPDEAYLTWKNTHGEVVRSLNMPGYVGGEFHRAGTKIINSNAANPSSGLPRASGVTLLYDTISTRITCIMESAYISSLRTASVTVLAYELLKGREVEHIAVIGAGVLAQAHIELLARRLPHIRHIALFDLEPERAIALQRHVVPILQERDITIHVTATAQEAITAAQLIIPATTTTEGYIDFAWLQPGALLVNISLDDPKSEVVLKADKVIVDDWHLVKNDPRRLLGRMYRAGQVSGPDEPASAGMRHDCRPIDAELGDIALGKKTGRTGLDQIILVNPFGLAIEDVAIASAVYQKAQELGMGRALER